MWWAGGWLLPLSLPGDARAGRYGGQRVSADDPATAILEDLVEVEDGLRWVHAMAHERPADPSVVLTRADDRPDLADPADLDGAGFDLPVTDHRALEAVHEAVAHLCRADGLLAVTAWELGLEQPPARWPDDSLAGALTGARLIARRVQLIGDQRLDGVTAARVGRRLQAARSAVDRAWRILMAALERGRATIDVGGGGACLVCRIREAADRKGGRCHICYQWRYQNVAYDRHGRRLERPAAIDGRRLGGASQAQVQARRRARAEGWGRSSDAR
jgi:hypothetical protein